MKKPIFLRYMTDVMLLLLKRLGIVMALYSLCRILFFAYNRHLFAWVDADKFILYMIYGLRFDLSVIVTLNAPFILISLLPMRAVHRPAPQTCLFYLFIFINSAALLFNCVDMEYFRFVNRRSTFHLFDFMFMGYDVAKLMPRFVWDFWYIPLLWGGLTLLLVVVWRRLSLPDSKAVISPVYYVVQPFLMLICVGLAIIAIRGGFQDSPITLKTSARMAGSRNVPLIINTPFSLLTTFGQRYVEEKAYFSATEAARHYSPLRRVASGEAVFRPKNVMVFIMESFSKEYMGPPHGMEGLTPFLDSLANGGLFCSSAFANGTDSISGIPAVVAGIPSLMPDPFISSAYASNRVASLAVILAGKGYHTSFYHGAKRGSLNLDAFCYSNGFKAYWGLDDYARDLNNGRWGADDPVFVKQAGNLWGAHDDPFFQYALERIQQQPTPFFSVIYSLSSHHPYTLPAEASGRYPKGRHRIHPAVRYADDALRHFFEKARNMPWFNDTVFVITADHTAQAGSAFYKSRVGRYAIPLIFFCPGDTGLKGVESRTCQQIDILPSVLDYLNYNAPFFAFGESIFDSNRKCVAISYQEGAYQLIHDSYVLHFDGEKTLGLFAFDTDPFLSNPLQGRSPEIRQQLETFCKAYIQVYNQAMIHNQLTCQ